jgi:hypothetical protein
MSALHVAAAMTVLAAAVRFSTLGVQSYWTDEGVTVHLVRMGFGDMLSALPHSESTPPLYYVLAWGWSKVFGTGDWGLRSLSAVLGTATVPVAYALAARLVSARAGAVAAALAAFSPLLVWYSQEARAYSLLLLLGGLSVLLMLRALEEPASRSAAWLWALVAALALATHYFALFAVVPEALWLLRRRRAVWPVAAIAAAGAALLPLAIEQVGNHAADFIKFDPLGKRILQVAKQYLVGYSAPGETAAEIAAVALAVVALFLLLTRARPVEPRGAWIAAAMGAVVVGLPLLIALAGADYFITRNVILGWLPFAVVLAAGFAARPVGIAGAGALCAIGLALVIAVDANPAYQRDDWRGAARALGPATVPRAIVASPVGGGDALASYLHDARAFPKGGAMVREIDVVGVAARRPGLPVAPPPISHPVYADFQPVFSKRTKTYTLIRLRAVPDVQRRELAVHLNYLGFYGTASSELLQLPAR